MGKPNLFRGALLAALCSVTACTVGPDFDRPASFWSPSSWFAAHHPVVSASNQRSQPSAEPLDPNWWSLFHDRELTSLEDRVAADNLDVRVASIRLAESRASLGVARAAGFPQVNANSSYTRELQSKKGVLSILGGSSSGGGSPGAASNGLGGTVGGVPNTGLFNPFDLFQSGFDASWELDFWGRVRRQVESARAALDVSTEARRDTLLSALAEVARDYVQLRGVQRSLQITNESIAIARQSVRITRDRAAGGLATELDAVNAQAQLETTRSQIPDILAQQQTLINAIALLLGEPPSVMDVELGVDAPIPPIPPVVPVGLPGELARRRPDIREAEANLHAATADIGVAVGDFYPRFTLSGSAALQATQFKNLLGFSAGTYSFGPSVTLPIFEGGRLTRTLELRKAQQQEAAITYQRTVLGALHDVNNTLTNYTSEQDKRAALQAALAQNRRALELARAQYTQGLTDFLTVLDAQRTQLAAEQQLNNSIITQSTNLVQLYKALGGGWEQIYPERPAPPTDFTSNLTAIPGPAQTTP